MKRLKAERVNAKTCPTIEDARSQIGAFIETIYKVERLHSTLGYNPPAGFEADRSRSRNLKPIEKAAADAPLLHWLATTKSYCERGSAPRGEL